MPDEVGVPGMPEKGPRRCVPSRTGKYARGRRDIPDGQATPHTAIAPMAGVSETTKTPHGEKPGATMVTIVCYSSEIHTTTDGAGKHKHPLRGHTAFEWRANPQTSMENAFNHIQISEPTRQGLQVEHTKNTLVLKGER